MEVELKLQLAPHDANALSKHALLKQYAIAPPEQLTMYDTYFDTPGLLLRGNRAGLRVRNVGNGWVQTMKGGGSVNGGLHRRHEWESSVAGPAPDLTALRHVVERKTVWRDLLSEPEVRDGLMPIFTTRVQRTVWLLRLPQGDEIECVLDQGAIECDGKSDEVSEIELELKSGQATSLFDVALALQQDIPMHIANLNKAERGYDLFIAQPHTALKAAALKLSKRMSVEQVFKAIVFNCLQQIQGNQPGVARGGDVESLHQMRVGLRRLRSALGMFKDLLSLPANLQQELDWLGAELGAARDWDVLAESTLPSLAQEWADGAVLADVRQAALDTTQQKHALASSAVASQRYTRLMLELVRWLQACGWRDGLHNGARKRLKRHVPRFARQTLLQDQRRLLKRGKRLPDATPEVRHRVRIAAKKSRYATEFFASLYPAGQVQPYVRELSALQDELGWLNDVAVADRLLRELPDGQPQLQAEAAFVRGYLAARSSADVRKMSKVWKRFSAIKAPA
ncbi:CYTH and CHAD domain-containing protein [Janthinobacterium agaricidamnosum]|uniref:CYTH domain protein n=1 Tax=Janthinobacterium agaricidamnosum NBRC 102515 = DSM 9628 TaxID=1349767 RepID=W0VBJ0_9BURK|nr:CHAD domain-containing protein [Janthinobacterium agaricidamnosum]CDG84652.1 CYTH domain protein [Janthinobacterium agaricidamnosum NBRC 102515 = DSM 9628]